MVKAEVVINKTVIITLTEREAVWLKAVCQNPLNAFGEKPNEDLLEAQMRRSIFEALKID